MKDLGSWLAEAETKLHETRNANGDLILSVARTVQKVSFSLISFPSEVNETVWNIFIIQRSSNSSGLKCFEEWKLSPKSSDFARKFYKEIYILRKVVYWYVMAQNWPF